MQKYQDVVLKPNGDVVSYGFVTVKNYPFGTTATIYSDNGATAIANPVTCDAYGNFSFFAANGTYNLTFSGTGFTSTTKTNVILYDPSDTYPGNVTLASLNNTPIGNTTPSTGAFTTLAASGATSLNTLTASGAATLTNLVYTPAGTGAVATTVQTKLRESVSVKDFGAVGDGITDDTVAIQAAITYAVSIASSITVPGLAKSAVYFPAGTYKTIAAIDATSLGAMRGASRAQSIINLSANGSTINCNANIELTDLAFVGNGANTAHSYTLAYLNKTTRCYFYNFANAANIANPSNASTFGIWRDNIFQSCINGVVFNGTVTTMRFKDNQFNTATGSAITTGNGFNFEICGNVFEDTVISININTQLSKSQISANWFEKNVATSVTPYQDSTAAPGYFTSNFISGNRYNATTVIQLGVLNTFGDGPGFTFSSINSVLNGNDHFTFGQNTAAPYGPLTAPVNATCASFSNPSGYTIVTQNANATQAATGGDFTIKTGVGSSGARSGVVRMVDTTGAVSLPVYATNAAAITGGMTAGMLYRTGATPDLVCIVH